MISSSCTAKFSFISLYLSSSILLISAAIFSNSDRFQDFSIRISENRDYLLPLDTEVEFELSNQSATVFQFDRGLDFIPDQENYLITIESLTNPKKCVHVGISDPSCPWSDDKRTIRNNKIWARILSLGYFSIALNVVTVITH